MHHNRIYFNMTDFKGLLMDSIDKLRQIKKYTHASESELGDMLGVNRMTVNAWRNRKRNPNKTNEEKIDRVYEKTKQGHFPLNKVLGVGGLLGFLWLVARGRE